MKFVSTFLLSFRGWELFSLTPFSLTENTLRPYENRKIKIFAVFSLIFHIALTICSLIFTNWYIDWKNQTTIIGYNNIIAMLSHQITSLVIVFEALIYTNYQIDFLHRMNKIDYAMTHRLQIKIDYEKCRFQNNVGFIVWILWHLISNISIYFFENEMDNRFQLLYIVPFVLYSLQYQRIILGVII